MASNYFNPINILNTSNAQGLGTGGSLNVGGGISIGGDTYLGGNINISGTTASFADNIIILNANTTTSQDSGILLQRFSGDITNSNNYSGIIYSEVNDEFQFGYISDDTRGSVSILNYVPIRTNTLLATTNISTDQLVVTSSISTAQLNSTNITTNAIRATTLITSANITNVNFTSTNILNINISTGTIRATNMINTNLSTGTLRVITLTTSANISGLNISCGTINANDLLTSANITGFNITSTNLLNTNISTNNVIVSTGVTTSTLLATSNISTNQLFVNSIASTFISSSTFTGGSMSLSGNLSVLGNVVSTSTTIANYNITNMTANTLVVTDNFNSTSMLNTIANIFTNTTGNVGINNTNPNYLLDINGSIRATGGDLTLGTLLVTTNISSGNFSATNITSINIINTNSLNTNITTAILRVSTLISAANTTSFNFTSTNVLTTNICTGTLRTSTLISSANMTNVNITSTNILNTNITTTTLRCTNAIGTNMTITNLFNTNITSNTIRVSNLITCSNLVSNIFTSGSIFTPLLSVTTVTGESIYLSGDLNIAGGLTVVNITTSNLLNTNISAGFVYVTDEIAAIGNYNTIGSIFTLGGNVGIGTVNPEYQLELTTDSAAKPGTNTWTISSDARLKTNITMANLDTCYNNIKSMPLKRYTWRDDIYTIEQVPDRSKLGWIAQDVENIFPKSVQQKNMYGYSDCRTLNSDQIIANLYGAVQKLIDKVETLENQIIMLQNA